MRYRGENVVENSVNEEYREGYRERRLEIALPPLDAIIFGRLVL
jgi:hypothetical protein